MRQTNRWSAMIGVATLLLGIGIVAAPGLEVRAVTTISQIGSDIDGETGNDESGQSVAMSADGTRIAIGAPSNDDNGNSAGQMRIYTWDGTTWMQTGADINGEAAENKLGRSVAMSADGTHIAIGAPRNSGNGSTSGHVRIYGMPAAPAVAAAPNAPAISSVTAANGSLTVSFTAGADGGSPVTNYKYSIDGTNYVALNPVSTTSPFTISGLTNGTSYSVSIKAVNEIGDSIASNAVTGMPVAPAPVVTPTTTLAPTVTSTTLATVITASAQKVIETKSELPMTGSNSSPLIALATILLSVGLVVITRRRIAR